MDVGTLECRLQSMHQVRAWPGSGAGSERQTLDKAMVRGAAPRPITILNLPDCCRRRHGPEAGKARSARRRRGR